MIARDLSEVNVQSDYGEVRNGGGHLNSAGAQADMEPEESNELKEDSTRVSGTDGEESDATDRSRG